ncbi:unnamed protein product, partial [Porites evermanni]
FNFISCTSFISYAGKICRMYIQAKFTNMAASRGLLKTVMPVSLKPKRIQTLEYLVLTNFFKSELFSCLWKVDHVIKLCKEPIAEEVEVYQRP